MLPDAERSRVHQNGMEGLVISSSGLGWQAVCYSFVEKTPDTNENSSISIQRNRTIIVSADGYPEITDDKKWDDTLTL
jgi:hypothetical protein